MEVNLNMASQVSKTIICVSLLAASAPVADAACPTAFRLDSAVPSAREPASRSEFRSFYGCYDLFTGNPLNCAFTHRVTGIEQPESDASNNGGHTGAHIGARPLVLADARNPEGKILFASDTDLAALSVAGSTLATPPFRGALLKHPTPEFSGSLAIDGEMIAPPGWLFCIFSTNDRLLPFHITAEVSVKGLEPLPLSGTDHQVVRRGLATHPDGTSATPQTIATLLKIAREYRALSGSKLSVNDLSLPTGGRFDIFNNWTSDHKSHRTGGDADINRTNIAGVTLPCTTDEDLHKAVGLVAAEAERPSLYCENPSIPDEDFKHIDF